MSETKTDWVQHALRQAPWRAQVQTAATVALILVVSAVVGALYLAQATTSAVTGRDLEALEAERARLIRANEELRAQIAMLQSVPVLIARAREMGFEPATHDRIEYLVVEGYSPRPEPITVVEIETSEPPRYDATLGGWFAEQWDRFVQEFEAWAGSAQEIGDD